jgi:hypothetical protein
MDTAHRNVQRHAKRPLSPKKKRKMKRRRKRIASTIVSVSVSRGKKKKEKRDSPDLLKIIIAESNRYKHRVVKNKSSKIS